MTQMMLYLMTFLSSFMFMQMNHPLAMGLMLLIQTLLICMITGLMSKTFWFSYILFLIFLGGMLILFIYVTSLASNEMFSMSMTMIFNTMIMMLLMISLSILMDKLQLINLFPNNEMSEMTNLFSYMYENNINLNKLYNYPNNFITIMLINYLLLCLIAIVKITNIFYGPLRPMK